MNHERHDGHVLVSRAGGSGRILLNRPASLNALTDPMVGTISAALTAWRHDPDVQHVVIHGAGERGLCAGGDIAAIHRDAIADRPGPGTPTAQFWTGEYRLNAVVATYPKPVVSLMDGIVLGGGVGISAHASLRVVTERSTVGMPETSIGFIPDVGGTWLLSRAPGELGTHLALTAGSVGAGDAIALELADWYVPSARLPRLLQLLENLPAAEAVLAVAEQSPAGTLAADREWVDRCYRTGDAPEVLARLRGDGAPGARRAADRIATNSPLAVAVTLRLLRAAAELPDLEAALVHEFRAAVRFLDAPDLAEGIRAAVIDKDRSPTWSPATLAEVSPEHAESFLAPLDYDLTFPPPHDEHLDLDEHLQEEW